MVSFKKVLIEECVEGVEISVSCLIFEHSVLACFYDIECSSPIHNTIDASFTSGRFTEVAQNLVDATSDFAADARIVDGIFHIQAIVDNRTGDSFVIEVTRRMPGDLYFKEIEYSTSISWSSLALNLLAPRTCAQKISKCFTNGNNLKT